MITETNAYSQMANICSRQECCSADIIARLKKNEISDKIAENVVESLKKEGFLDDSRYAHAFVHDKFAYNHWGRQKIKIELQKKRIPSNIIEDALADVDEEEYVETLESLARSKKRTVSFKNGYELRMKLARFCYSRGFELDLINEVVDKIVENEE